MDEILAPQADGRTIHQGWSPQCEKDPSPSNEEWGVLKTTAIQAGKFCPEHNKRLPDKLSPRPQLEVRKGDLLITCAGPRVRCGVPCLVRETRPRLLLSGKMYRFWVPDGEVSPEFIEAFLLSMPSQNAIDKIKTGTSDSGLNLTHARFRKLPVVIPPFNEQRRIVAKIESLQARSSRAREALAEVKPLLEQLRRSVLQAAFSGRLTADWRAEHPDVEPASELLARIRTQRRQRWEQAELAKYEAKGKKPPKRWREKYKEPAPVDESGLPELPEGWCWATLGEVFEVQVGATPSRKEAKFWDGSIPWVSSGEVAFCRIRSTRETITELGLAKTSTNLHPAGTILLGMIGEGKTRGQAAILDIEACNNQNSAAIRVTESGLRPEYLYHHLSFVYEQTRRVGSGNNQPALNKSRVEAMTFPLAPLAEQHEISHQIEELLHCVAELESINADSKSNLTQLDQSILAKAFRGELVPQDPRDEPAAELLERIRAAREASDTDSKKAKRRKSKS